MDAFDLPALLDPLVPGQFFEQYWEKQHLLLKRDNPGFYHGLLSVADIDHLINSSDARYPAIRLAKDGGFFPPEAYTRNVKYGDDSFNGVPDVEKIFTQYLAGATVTLPALHRTWPPLAQLCAQLEAYLDHPVHTNVYVTPARAAGFAPHYDTHGVFILQIAGVKQWRIDPPPLPLPHRSQPFAPERYTQPESAMLELTLHAGDLLYLPRGYVHSTTTAASFSAHITIGVTVYTWMELATQLLQGCVAMPKFREALPPGFATRPETRPALRERLRELIAGLAESADFDQAIEALSVHVRAAQPRSGGAFHADMSAIGPGTRLVATRKPKYEDSPDGAATILELDGRRVLLPHGVRPALQAMGRTEPFTPESLPGALALEGKLALVRYLYGLGMLKPL